MHDLSGRTPDMLALLKKLVEIESPSDDRHSLQRLGKVIATEARRLGARVELHERPQAGPHVLARWGEGAGGILLLCHMDTVFPPGTLERMPFHEQQGRTFGPGVLDMKGGIVVALQAVEALRDAGQIPPRPLSALFTSDEESGSHTSRSLIEDLARQARMVFVLEPAMPDGALKTWRKGVGGFTLTARGRAAHAGGAHEKGRNAILELAHQVIRIEALTDYARGTSLNVGVVHGGTVSNVVPDQASASVDLRLLDPAEWSRIHSAMQKLKPVLEGTRLELSGDLNRPPMPATPAILEAFEEARRIARGLGLELKAGGTGGGSDANFVAPLGVPVLDGLGPVGDDYHSEKEFLFTASLPERTRLLAALMRDWP